MVAQDSALVYPENQSATIAFETLAENQYINPYLRIYGDLTLPDELRIDPT